MKKDTARFYLVIAGAIIFNWVFWREKIGINALLFDAFICIATCWLFPFGLKNRAGIWILAGHILSGAMVLINNTLLSKISFSVTLLAFITFSQYIHRSLWYAAGSSLLNYLFVVPNLVLGLKKDTSENSQRHGGNNFRMFLIPAFMLIVFGTIYAGANGIFSHLVSNISDNVYNWFRNFLDWFSFGRILFFLLGIYVAGGLLLKSRNFFSDIDLKQKNDLARKKAQFKKWLESPSADIMHIIIGKRVKGILALKSEYLIGTISLVLLNLLLLLINAIDVKYIWLGYSFSNITNITEFVHEGTGMLILSIILAMLLLLFFFRGNINFYKKNKWLTYFSYLWIVQNFFLTLSVFNRDYYYISHYGLAYKRIGLLFFLLMVLSGLVTIFLKICSRKTVYYLLRLNAWVALGLMVLATVVDWDVAIARYNISHSNTILVDITFLLSLSDNTLPAIGQHQELLQTPDASKLNFYYHDKSLNAIAYFKEREKSFLDRQQHFTWLSWNVADNKTKIQLKKNLQLSTLK